MTGVSVLQKEWAGRRSISQTNDEFLVSTIFDQKWRKVELRNHQCCTMLRLWFAIYPRCNCSQVFRTLLCNNSPRVGSQRHCNWKSGTAYRSNCLIVVYPPICDPLYECILQYVTRYMKTDHLQNMILQDGVWMSPKLFFQSFFLSFYESMIFSLFIHNFPLQCCLL